jgi:alanine racemase
MKRAKVWVEVSRSALLQNVRSVCEAVKPAKIMAVVKSNAYGHGMAGVAACVRREVGWFGVDSVDEALELRKKGIRKPVLILGYVPPERLSECARYGFSFVAYNLETLKAVSKIRAKTGAFKVHLKIETGTTRQGLEGAALEAFVRRAMKIPSVRLEGAYTHYANIEDTTDPSYAMKQLKRFRTEVARIRRLGASPAVLHTACSAAAILYPETRFGMIRLGISLYGHWSSKETLAAARQKGLKIKLTPALSWKTVVAQVKTVPKGTPVSYGLTETVSRPSKLAVLPVGYWDGLDRGLSSVGCALIRGRRCKIMGRVCMNMTVVDVTDIRSVKAGDEVVLIGKQGSEVIIAEEIASKIGSISYEVLTRINPVIERRYTV